jgi:hypothetical protein
VVSLPLPLLHRGCLVGLEENIPGSTPAPPTPIDDQTATARRAQAAEGRARLLGLGFGDDVGWPMFCSLVELLSLLC